jgi:hypothetical protein
MIDQLVPYDMKLYYPLNSVRPWHYSLFGDYRWYRKWTKGLWQRLDVRGAQWVRVKERFDVRGIHTEDWRRPAKG